MLGPRGLHGYDQRHTGAAAAALPVALGRGTVSGRRSATEVEFVAGDMPAKWHCHINHDFHEVKLFLATQIMDEARQLDVFRKRALANGGGLMMASSASEEILAAILEAPNYCTMVAKVGLDRLRTRLYEIAFEGLQVRSIREVEDLGKAARSHFVLEGPLGAWREMLENIRQHHVPDREHTLNYLTLPDDPMRVSGLDQLETDAFYRYNETLQRFFNGSASVETVYQ